MMRARNAAIVVLPSSSKIVALISQMQSTASRHGPAAMIEACANDAMRSTMELLRYRRSSAKPMPAMGDSILGSDVRTAHSVGSLSHRERGGVRG